jgi:hypothetical protein
VAAASPMAMSCRPLHVHTFSLRACGLRASFRGSLIEISTTSFSAAEKHEVDTHNFPVKQIILPFPTIPFEPRAHIHTCPYHRNGLVETLRDQWVVHLAFRDGPLPLGFSGPNELDLLHVNCPFFAGLHMR